jgi:creatinine amidohydrolase/Fe(II)-dependent formamide hydrolase-like protein
MKRHCLIYVCLLCFLGQFHPWTTSARAAAATPQTLLMEEMTMTDVRDAIAAGKTTALVFSASIESSGPHIVLGKHMYKVRYLGERIARELGLPFLGTIPLGMAVREGGDSGRPITVTQPESEPAQHFLAIAQALAARVSVLNLEGAGGEIEINLGPRKG